MSLKSPLLFYSEIYPVSEYFFYLRAMDQSKTYTPVSQTVIDIPTAIAFFGPDGCSDTLARVHTGVERLINEWNRRFCRNDVVRTIFVSYYHSILTTHALCVVFCLLNGTDFFSRAGNRDLTVSSTKNFPSSAKNVARKKKQGPVPARRPTKHQQSPS